jgi:hypothetical protein
VGARVSALPVKVGETLLPHQHDTSEVLPEDLSHVQATMHCILGLEKLSTIVPCKVCAIFVK